MVAVGPVGLFDVTVTVIVSVSPGQNGRALVGVVEAVVAAAMARRARIEYFIVTARKFV